MTDFEQLGDLLKNLIYMAIYPFIRLIEMLLNVWTDITNSFMGLYSALSGLAGIVSNFIVGFLSGLFLVSWIVIISIGISLVVLLRIYFFIRGSSST